MLFGVSLGGNRACVLYIFYKFWRKFFEASVRDFPKKSREPKSLRDICRKILLKTKKFVDRVYVFTNIVPFTNFINQNN